MSLKRRKQPKLADAKHANFTSSVTRYFQLIVAGNSAKLNVSWNE